MGLRLVKVPLQHKKALQPWLAQQFPVNGIEPRLPEASFRTVPFCVCFGDPRQLRAQATAGEYPKKYPVHSGDHECRTGYACQGPGWRLSCHGKKDEHENEKG
jgi:hypothetical protein